MNYELITIHRMIVEANNTPGSINPILFSQRLYDEKKRLMNLVLNLADNCCTSEDTEGLMTFLRFHFITIKQLETQIVMIEQPFKSFLQIAIKELLLLFRVKFDGEISNSEARLILYCNDHQMGSLIPKLIKLKIIPPSPTVKIPKDGILLMLKDLSEEENALNAFRLKLKHIFRRKSA